MKLKLAFLIGMAMAILVPSSQLQAAPGAFATENTCLNESSYSLSVENTPVFKVRICFNALVFSVCVTLECKFHWTDALVPGAGNLFDGYGCEVVGNIMNDGQTSTLFEGTEEMIQSIERAMNIKIGSLTNLQVGPSPEFAGPDGNQYRVVAKTYEVLQGEAGRYLPLELELVK
jgi:hypothetical protein